jgi:hypothetical protein
MAALTIFPINFDVKNIYVAGAVRLAPVILIVILSFIINYLATT